MEMTQCTCVAKCLNCSDRAESAEAEVKRLREVMDRIGSDWRRRAKRAEAELEHQMVNLADWRDLAVRRLADREAAEASAAAMREALWSVGAELVHRKPSHDADHHPDEDCEACVFEAMLQHIDRALSSSAGVALLERLRTAEEKADMYETLRDEAAEVVPEMRARYKAAEKEREELRAGATKAGNHIGQLDKELEKAETRIARLEYVLGLAVEPMCDAICPALWPPTVERPHHPDCVAVRAALEGK